MRIIRSFIAPAAALAVASGIAVLPALTSAPSASAAVSCTGTSLVPSVGAAGDRMRMPTVGNGTRNWHCQLGLGNAGVAVARLQIALDSVACNPPGAGLTVDGIYGPLTEAAVKAVQKSAGITQDGIYGPVTAADMLWPLAAGSPDFGNCGFLPNPAA
jgi:peptidoglycan hydrolase-like protein with peptidoglycan-binding domain